MDDLQRDDARPLDVSAPRGPLVGEAATPVVAKRDDVPQLAVVESLWSRPVRIVVASVVVVAIVGYSLFGTILARNVTFNRLVDPGARNGIRSFARETIVGVWQTMWDRAPAFGSIDLTRTVLLVSTLVFFLAFAFIIFTVFVPSREEWNADLDDRGNPDTSPGD